MLRFLPFLLGTALCCAPVCAQDAPDATDQLPAPSASTKLTPDDAAPVRSENDYKVEPGQRAGDVLLGMTSKAILDLKGKPTELFPRSEGMEEIIWKGADGHVLRVILASDVIVQIGVDDPRFKDPFGNSSSSPLAAILARYRTKGYDAPKRALYSIEDPEGGGYEAQVFDDVETGVAFGFYLQDDLIPGTTPPSEVIVHRAGKPALPGKGAKPISPEQRAARERARSAPPPTAVAPTPRPQVLRALGNGLPLTEKVDEDGSRGWGTDVAILPSGVNYGFYAFTSLPPGGGRLWHPLVWMFVGTAQDRAVWQGVSSLTLSFGGRRLQLEASKQTINKGGYVHTVLNARVPFRDFLEVARAGSFSLSVDQSSFAVQRGQTLGLRALARLCGGYDISSEAGAGGNSGAAPTSNRRPTRNQNEFFPQTSRRRLSQKEVEDMSDSDLRLAINEMYARYGLGFKDKALQARFEALGWYHPRDDRTYASILAMFSDVERDNVDMLAEERKSRR